MTAMMTADPVASLSAAAKRVAARLVFGETDDAIAAHLYLSVHSVRSQLQAARRHVGCSPRASRAVLVHVLLTARHVDPPACQRPAPRLDENEQRLLYALTRHSRTTSGAVPRRRRAARRPPERKGGLDMIVTCRMPEQMNLFPAVADLAGGA